MTVIIYEAGDPGRFHGGRETPVGKEIDRYAM